MVKKLILVVVLVALIFGIFALLENRGFHGIYEPWKIGAEDNGREIVLHAPSRIFSGQLLILTLESNPTTGYSWELAEFDEAVLKLKLYKYVPHEHAPGQMGVGGEKTWYFQAQSQGSATLHLEYARSWEEGVEPAKTFTVQVTARPPSLFPRFWEAK